MPRISELTSLVPGGDSLLPFAQNTGGGAYATGKTTVADLIDANRALILDGVNTAFVVDTAALAALDETQWLTATTADGLQWVFSATSAAAQIAFGDPLYVAPASDLTGASGAWVRAGSVNDNWQPTEWGTSDISIYNGAFAAKWTRTGGIGTIGANFTNLKVTAATPFPQFDVAVTGFTNHTNAAGGAWYGGWFAAVSPALSLGHTFSAGFGNGIEVNIGPRSNVVPALADDLGSTFDLVGVRVVPDVAPTDDGLAYEAISGITIATPGVLERVAHGYRNGLAGKLFARTGTLPTGFTEGGLYYVVNVATDTFQLSSTKGGTGIATTGTFAAGVAFVPSYAASFGVAVGKSDDKNEFWTGFLCSVDTIVAGGIIARLRGASSLVGAPGSGILMDGFVTTGINLAFGSFTSNNAVFLGSGHRVLWSGNAALSSTSGDAVLTTGNADSDGALKSNAGALTNLAWDGTGGVTRLGFNGTTPVAKPTVTGSRGANAALASLCTQLAALGLITDSTS